MRLSRRVVLGRFAALAAVPLLAACRVESATSVTPTQTPPESLAAKTFETPTLAPTLVPTAVPVAEPTPEPVPVAVGRPMYQMDAQHTGRSPNRGPRQAKLMRSFDTGNFQVRDGATPQPDIQSSAAIGPDGTIYLANQQGVLFAL